MDIHDVARQLKKMGSSMRAWGQDKARTQKVRSGQPSRLYMLCAVQIDSADKLAPPALSPATVLAVLGQPTTPTLHQQTVSRDIYRELNLDEIKKLMA